MRSETEIADWRHAHNVIIPGDPLSLDEVRERLGRNQLEVAYQGEVLVGCTTVRPPADAGAAAVVIVRVFPEHRGQGIGRQLYTRALEQAGALGGDGIETIVWAANTGGLRFAQAAGFVEVSRYLPPDEDVPYVTLRLT
ncbi:GNAT family N-acetyltransferase [Catellatospora sichuanensis]|uniref:GNAT family N-acetyltransferase n=1 Tax=Catellatospora sichuanensis TaxID=1969805 RepID=UPI001FE8B940|nr:GNAT family N-acetyltransferase [Catellatospora sichuanensis]